MINIGAVATARGGCAVFYKETEIVSGSGYQGWFALDDSMFPLDVYPYQFAYGTPDNFWVYACAVPMYFWEPYLISVMGMHGTLAARGQKYQGNWINVDETPTINDYQGVLMGTFPTFQNNYDMYGYNSAFDILLYPKTTTPEMDGEDQLVEVRVRENAFFHKGAEGSAGHQQWNNYPETPALTVDYPLQTVFIGNPTQYGKPGNPTYAWETPTGQPMLVISKGEYTGMNWGDDMIYWFWFAEDCWIQSTVNVSPVYLLVDGAWELNEQPVIFANITFQELARAVESNFDIYKGVPYQITRAIPETIIYNKTTTPAQDDAPLPVRVRDKSAYWKDAGVAGDGYQHWENYPDTPVLSSIWPYQFCWYIDAQQTYLYCAPHPIWVNDAENHLVFMTSDNHDNWVREYLLTNGAWVLHNTAATITTNMNDVPFTETNCIIWNSDSFNVLYFLKTTTSEQDGAPIPTSRRIHI